MVPIDGHEVRVSHPGKLYFSGGVELTKLDLVNYYLAVAPGAIGGVRDRPFVLKRFVNGACLQGTQPEPFYQKRAPADRPEWLRTATLSFPSGRTAEEIVIDDAAGLIWVMNLGCIELHPHPVRTGDLDHPDELRVDLDPQPGVGWEDVRRVALDVQAVLADAGLVGWVKTSGSRGMHVNVRIAPRWSFTEVRRAALALSRAVERGAPTLATSKWWKEERHGVFLDYNQNAKDRTTCSAYSVRPVPDARVSMPLEWSEVPECEPADFTVLTAPTRFAERGDAHQGMDDAAGSLEGLLELAARDEAEGLADAPWPPHFRKMEGEAPRVAPSRAKSAGARPASAKSDVDQGRKDAAEQDAVAGDPCEARPARRLRWRVWNDGRETGMLKRRRCWRLTMCWWIGCGDGLVHLDAHPGEPAPCSRGNATALQETPDPDDDPTREWARRAAVDGAPAMPEPMPSGRSRRWWPARAAGPLQAARRCSRLGALSVRHLRNCAMCRKRLPCMCS